MKKIFSLYKSACILTLCRVLYFKLLHLIGLALHEEQEDVDKKIQNESSTYSFKFLEKSFINKSKKSTDFLARLSSKSEENLIKYLTETVVILTTEPHSNTHQLLADWTLQYAQKLLKLKHKVEQRSPSATSETSASAVNEKPKSSKSDQEKATGETTTQQDEQTQAEKRKHQMAEKRRAKIMAKLNQLQKNFIENNQEFYDETKTSVSTIHSSSSGSDLLSFEEQEYQ